MILALPSPTIYLEDYMIYIGKLHPKIDQLFLQPQTNLWPCPLIRHIVMTSTIMAILKTKSKKAAVKINLDDYLSSP